MWSAAARIGGSARGAPYGRPLRSSPRCLHDPALAPPAQVPLRKRSERQLALAARAAQHRADLPVSHRNSAPHPAV